jgi:CRP-like cAMP-binding protein/Fe-S-cluster-containing hydrogenase component 2
MGDVRTLELSDELRQKLAAVPLLAHIEPEALDAGLELCPVLSVPPAVRIVVEGEYDDRFYVLLEGRCDVSKEQGGIQSTITNLASDTDKSDQPRSSTTLVSLVGGDFFGEMSCMSPWPRSSTVTTTAPSVLLEIDNDVFDDWMKASDGFREVMEAAYMSRGLKALLRGLDAFSMLGDDSLGEMIEGAGMSSFKKDEAIVTEGDDGDAFYVIRGGVVSVEKATGDGSHIVSYLRAGNYFGEMALLDGTPRTATVRATNNTEVIRIDREGFTSVVAKHPRAAEQLRRTVAKRLQAEAALIGDGAAEALSFMAGQGILEGTDVLLVDLAKCIYCGNCEEACADSHKVSLITLHGPTYQQNLFPTACRNCDDPLCLMKCPVDAIQRDRSGEVKIYDHCIGCSGCAVNCPYDTIAMTPISAEEGEEIRTQGGFKKPITRQAVKCDLCEGISGGPQCVASCPTAAILRFQPKELVKHIVDKGSK